jgi:4-amino-4-deoxy-L-arabinose transferase-like glycosyltransferase
MVVTDSPRREGPAGGSARPSFGRVGWLLTIGALATVALHLAFSGLYGYQRDELYFIECARHPAWGYVDQPPLIAFIAAISLHLFGASLVALRLLPALAAGVLVGLTGYCAYRAGGQAYAIGIAMIGVALAPFDLAVGSLLTMNAFEPIFWLMLALLVFTQLETPQHPRWLAIGAVVGIGTLNKWSMALYAAVLLAGVALSPARRVIGRRGLAGAMLVAAAIVAPNVGWQAIHGWPQLAVLHNAGIAKNEHLSPLIFLLEQLPLMNPLCAPLWLAGLVALSRSPRYGGFAIAYGLLLLTELVLGGKVYYVAPAYPALIAVGAVAVERATRAQLRLRAGLAGAVAVAGLALMPLATPALPLPALLGYQHAIDVRSIKMENHPAGLVPQQFADQLGWNELVRTVAGAVATLSPRERRSAAVLTGDYGQAAALDFLGRNAHLPPAISGHNQYFLWGARGEHAAVVAIGVPQAVLAREYRSIERVATYRSPYVLPQNSNLPVYVCRRPRMPLARFWPQLRRYV